MSSSHEPSHNGAHQSRSKRRADRIRADVPIAQIMSDLGYAVYPDYGDREQQYSCDLHGDGNDGTPSARLYPATQSTYCFACGKSRDAIRVVMEKMGKSFPDALAYVESRYGLPALPWDSDDEVQAPPTDQVQAALDGFTLESTESTEDLHKRISRGLHLACKEHTLKMEACLKLSESLDRAAFLYEEGFWDGAKFRASLAQIQERLIQG